MEMVSKMGASSVAAKVMVCSDKSSLSSVSLRSLSVAGVDTISEDGLAGGLGCGSNAEGGVMWQTPLRALVSLLWSSVGAWIPM